MPLRTLRTASTNPGSRLVSVASAQPSSVLRGAELGARIGRTADWIESRTGIRQVRALIAGERIGDLAISAATAACQGDDRRVDLVISASCSIEPGGSSISEQVTAALMPGVAHFELNAACAGFCYALATADSMIKHGDAKRVLIVAAEHMTSIIDPADPGTSFIFGDGAGAAVVEASSQSAIGPVAWGSDGTGASLIEVRAGTSTLRMQGQQVFRWAVEAMVAVGLRACEMAGVSPRDIDVFVPHQANARIVDALTTKLGLDHTTVSRDIIMSGNTSAASIPIAAARLLAENPICGGQLALLIGFGAGLTYAAQVIRLPVSTAGDHQKHAPPKSSTRDFA